MHLLLIHQNFPGQFRDLAPAWLHQGHRVTALGTAPAPKLRPQWEGLTYLQYSLNSSELLSAIERGNAVAGICQEYLAGEKQPDLVLVHSGWGEAQQLRDVFPSTPLVVFPELWGTPEALGFGFDQHLEGESANTDWFTAQNQLAADAIAASDAALVACEAQRRSFPPALQEQLTVLPEGLALERYGVDPSASISVNGRSFFAGQPLVTLVSRTLEPLRGLRQALLAWPLIAAAHQSAQLILVGDHGEGYGQEAPKGCDHLSAGLSEIANEVDLNRIHILGSLEHKHVLRLLQCSACHLALSYPYTLSWSVLEAMACEAALISNEGSPIALELIDGHNGVLVPFNDHQALAQKVLSLLGDPDRRSQLGKEARRTIEQHFDMKNSLQSYQTLFESLIQNPLI